MEKNKWHNLESHPEVFYGQYVVPNFISNSIAIKQSDNEFILISPGKSLLKCWPEKWSGENIKINIIIPNNFHYMGVPAWQEKFPNHRIYASQKAIPRLLKKGLSNITPLEQETPVLPENYECLFPLGHRSGDVWLHKKSADNGLWITCDSFLNYERLSKQPIAKSLQKLLGAAPGLKMSQVIKWGLLDSRKDFKSWVLAQLLIDKPSILIPSHGELIVDTQLPEKLKTLVTSRL